MEVLEKVSLVPLVIFTDFFNMVTGNSDRNIPISPSIYCCFSFFLGADSPYLSHLGGQNQYIFQENILQYSVLSPFFSK